ncbi:nucleolar protein 8-like isoform X2 [Boleophthalmus pectinirostris]|uniref:nucleolar protein 8-like isoform X2 n=1 Tax=Boleophthalmus pectinirostris TaxID=150288 RepID=UPI00242B0A4A|nr:nucleolar protein 8-like isoform X2 [Boleophthalmus pectinirostris]
MFFEVSADLKVVFGKETENQEKKDEEEEKNWDQEEGGDEERGDEERGEETEKEESGGFKFSFFGDEPEPEPQQTEYKVQSILAPKLSWQQDPRLNDSSEEEEEEERGEEEEEEEEERTAPEESTEASSSLFFFSSGDPRLTDGPRWFCRTSLEEQRETWDQTRTQLRQDCKKKHKDARRKLRAPR